MLTPGNVHICTNMQQYPLLLNKHEHLVMLAWSPYKYIYVDLVWNHRKAGCRFHALYPVVFGSFCPKNKVPYVIGAAVITKESIPMCLFVPPHSGNSPWDTTVKVRVDRLGRAGENWWDKDFVFMKQRIQMWDREAAATHVSGMSGVGHPSEQMGSSPHGTWDTMPHQSDGKARVQNLMERTYLADQENTENWECGLHSDWGL